MRAPLALVLAGLLSLPATAGPPPPGPPASPTPPADARGPQRREEIRQRVQQKVRTFLAVELSSKLSLDDAKSMKLADAIEAHMTRRRAGRDEVKLEAQKLRELLDKKAPDAQVKAQLDVVVKKHTRGEDVEGLLADTAKFLSVTEQARLALALPEVMRDVREMMRDARRSAREGMGRRGGRGRGVNDMSDELDD